MSEDIKLPNRGSDIYKEIGDFELYELTNCIAYEMAIRNSELQKLIKEITREHHESDNLVELDKKLEYYFFNVDIIKHIENSFDRYFKDYYEEFYNYCEYVKAEIVLHNKEFSKEELESIKNNIKKILDFFYNNLPRFKFYFDDYIPEEKIHNNSKEMVCLYYGNKDTKIINEKKEKAIITKNDFMRFKRPRLILPKNKDRSIELKINLDLPKNELIAYISKIKVEYDKDNSIIKSPLELLGETFNIQSIDFKNMTPKEWADNFFIYDYFKKSTDKVKATKLQKIQELLTEYNGIKVKKSDADIKKSKNRNDNSKFKIVSYEAYLRLREDGIYAKKETKPFYSIATINDRLKLMTSLIDDLKYKTLIS